MIKSSEPVRGLSVDPVSELRYDSGYAQNRYESSGLLISMIPVGSRVLDIGCGTGSISRMAMSVRSAEVVGIEPNVERAEQAKRNAVNVECGFYNDDFAEKNGKFTIIMFADVLEHLVDPLDMLQAIKKSLEKDGRVLASIPNVAHWSVRLRLLCGKFNYRSTGIMDATHLRWFTRESVRRLFVEAGYDIEYLHSAPGAWMRVYNIITFGCVSLERRSFLLSKLCLLFPGLFAAQHIISAKLRLGNTLGAGPMKGVV